MNKTITDLPGAARAKLRTEFVRIDDQTFAGYVVDERDLSRRHVVEFLLDGYPIKVARADAYSNELAIENVGDACYGFMFSIPPQAIDQNSIAEVRLANTSVVVGCPLLLREPGDSARNVLRVSELRWLGGLRFEGWCVGEADRIPTVTAIVDGETVAEAKATRWGNVGDTRNARLARRFDLHLPARFADGRAKRVQVVRENGEDLPGSPITIVAFEDGLKRAIERLGNAEDERARAAQFDRMHPMSMPFSEYASWLERFPLTTDRNPDASPVAVALVGSASPKASLQSLRNCDFADWVVAALPETEGPSAFDPEHLKSFLTGDADKSEYVLFTHAGTRFAPTGLCRIIAAFHEFSEAAVVYGDFDVESDDGKSWPVALPAFDYERMLEQGYCAHLFALRRDAALAAIEAGASNLYALFMSAVGKDADGRFDKIVHIPGSLATLAVPDAITDHRPLAQAASEHLRARDVAAEVTYSAQALFPAARVARSIPPGSTTIIIPVRNQPELLQTCLRSIQPATTSGAVDIMIVDNDSSDPAMLQLLNGLSANGTTVISVPGAFNFARLNNIAAEKASSDFLCLLNNDVEATDDQWLNEMLSRIGEEDVGAVGALLLWPSGVVQHGGTVLGPNFGAEHAFCDRLHTDPGYADLLHVAHECSAVTAACLLTRRSDYLDAGGMDELHFPVNYNDVDYCLKLRAKGKRIVLTPRARLLHRESASRGQDYDRDRAARFGREVQNLRARWGECLVSDPYYNPILSLDAVPFSALAWPPRSRAPRTGTLPIAADIPPGF